MTRNGLLLSTIGSPAAPTPAAVAKYLRDFLMDREVINLPYVLRAPLVQGLIVPLRKKSSAHKYQSVWLDEGSPLTVYTENFASAVGEKLGGEWAVAVGYRHGLPTIGDAVQRLCAQGAKRIVLASLFPQSAPATTGSTRDQFLCEMAAIKNVEPQVFEPFFAEAWFAEAYAHTIRDHVDLHSLEHLLFSYHGLPLRSPATAGYRDQCVQTTQEIVRALGGQVLPHTTCFQSRLGPARWLEPSTFATIQELARQGVKRVAVVCPSFVSDCIETLEEIGIQAREVFLGAGGQEFHLVPCLNADPKWVDLFAKAIRQFAVSD